MGRAAKKLLSQCVIERCLRLRSMLFRSRFSVWRQIIHGVSSLSLSLWFHSCVDDFVWISIDRFFQYKNPVWLNGFTHVFKIIEQFCAWNSQSPWTNKQKCTEFTFLSFYSQFINLFIFLLERVQCAVRSSVRARWKASFTQPHTHSHMPLVNFE